MSAQEYLFLIPDSKDLDTAAELAGAPSNFFCPISMHLFRDPVVLPTGQT